MSSTQTNVETTQECRARLLQEQAERQRAQQRIAEEKKKEEERLAKEHKREEDRIAEQERQEEERCAQAQDNTFCRMVEESRKEKAKAAQELAERRERAALAALRRMGTTTPQEPLGSKQKIYKSTAIVCDSLEEEITEGKEKQKGVTPRGVKRNRIRMVGRIGGLPGGDSDPGSEEDDNDDNDDDEPEPSNKTPEATGL
ncbi:hypothetical protein F5050DRAFT_1715342 [Lentinula boryana]|uniref:Uncharacterized protein n=1 Tax=Lentinula boryana TaxID=40481 RepID=A0ABQ8Q0Y2_9AGAR|nr:hypothetical protein F5050DRAFT_1715342 [Lentinula boryana]